MKPLSEEHPPDLSRILELLRHSKEGSDRRTVGSTVRALQLMDAEPEILAFVKGKSVRSVQREWGDNDRSFWAHLILYPALIRFRRSS